MSRDLDNEILTSRATKPIIRLDRIANPLGPVDRVMDAVSRFDEMWSRLPDPALN